MKVYEKTKFEKLHLPNHKTLWEGIYEKNLSISIVDHSEF
jgi:hypothetical protein